MSTRIAVCLSFSISMSGSYDQSRLASDTATTFVFVGASGVLLANADAFGSGGNEEPQLRLEPVMHMLHWKRLEPASAAALKSSKYCTSRCLDSFNSS